MLREQGERVARRSHLVEAKQQPLLAFAIAATRHVEAHADVAELLEHRGRPHHVIGSHAAAEAVQDDEGRPPLTRLEPIRHADNAHELEALGGEADTLFGHSIFPGSVVKGSSARKAYRPYRCAFASVLVPRRNPFITAPQQR